MRNFPYTLASVGVLLAACAQPQPAISNTAAPNVRSHTVQTQKRQPAQRQYLALPGQSAVRVGTADADEAFDRQVAAYSGGTVTATPKPVQVADPIAARVTGSYLDAISDLASGFPTPQPVQTQIPAPAPLPTTTVPAAADSTLGVSATTTAATTTPSQPLPAVSQPNPLATGSAAAAAAAVAAAALPSATASPAANAVPGTADYAVQITNGTTGRIFVEAQDAADHIFPIGPMFGGQSINTPPDPIGPLQGPITVVIRDPDKDGAPEIRRYQVQPPANYKGKTIGITILPGGQYRADVDKEVYYTSPPPAAAQPAPSEQAQ